VDNAHVASSSLVMLNKDILDDQKILNIFISDFHFSIIILLNKKPIYFNVKKVISASELMPKLFNLLNDLANHSIDIKSMKNIFISGDNISKTTIEKLENNFEINVSKINPFEHIKVDPALAQNSALVDKYNTFSSATGIALRLV